MEFATWFALNTASDAIFAPVNLAMNCENNSSLNIILTKKIEITINNMNITNRRYFLLFPTLSGIIQ